MKKEITLFEVSEFIKNSDTLITDKNIKENLIKILTEETYKAINADRALKLSNTVKESIKEK